MLESDVHKRKLIFKELNYKIKYAAFSTKV